jgi:CheY-like chemotaxis protein/AraC-like DNA-binding protein
MKDKSGKGLEQHASGEGRENEAPLILVVEDDIDILSFIALELMEDYQVVKAVDGQEGLLKALEHIPDLVVTDLMMPRMDGITLCRKLKTNPDTSHIPVVMLTAKTSDESQLEGLKTGADDYVTKPFNIVLLQARIANLLETRRVLREQLRRKFSQGEHPLFAENTPDREFLERATHVVEGHYSDWDFHAEAFAAALGMSLRTLQRKLKAVVNLSPAGFISEFRMKRAAELLALTSYTVTEIAFKVGYDESSSFSRVFKKHFKMSPSTYRSSHCTS